MAITPLPTPPSRDDPTNFSARGDAFLGALPTFATEANALAVDVNADAVAAAAAVSDAEDAAVVAQAASGAALAAANVTKWISGTTYTEGTMVWSPISYLSYRRKTTGGGTTDPSIDTTNWELAAGTGYRNIPASADKTGSYSLATTDVGKVISVGTGGLITVPDATFASGDAVLIFNNTSGDVTLTMSITTAYIAGTDADKATITLATRGIANILFVSGTICTVTGNVS